MEKIKEALQMTENQEISSAISGKTSPKRAAARSRPMTMSASPRTKSTRTMIIMTSPIRPDTDKKMKMRMSKILKIRDPSKGPYEF